MKISIAADKVHFTLPVPLSIASFIAPRVIKSIPENKLPADIKSYVIEVIPSIISNLKEYKGMTIVDIETAKGEKVVIKV